MAQELEQDASLLQDYLTECDELLQNLDRDLVALESSPDDKELLNSIFRAFHTVKGTSGFLGFTHIVELTHHAEDVLNVLRKGQCEVTRSTMDALLATLDQLREMLGDVRTGEQHTYEIRHLLRDLHSSIPEDAGNSPIATPAAASVSAKPADAGMVHQNDGWLSAPSASAPPGEISSRRSAAASETARTIRVDVAKLDELINLVGELVLERNRLQHLSRTLSDRQTAATDDFKSALLHSTERLSFITDELQTAGLSTRMVSVEAIFRRFPRMVRDLAGSLGKQVELVIRGEETELDKTIAEEIADPLIHLLRNSLDHGIERPQVRVERGKSPKGTVRVEARPEGDNVIIEIADDGAGMDVARVGKKALEKGLVTQDQLAAMGSREILDLIFLPGFSTAEQVSDVSGRGVGMDVVRSNIKKLNGTVELESELGRGSCIRLRLPLTLAILPVLLVAVDRETYALPLRAVVETIRVNASDIHRANHVDMLRLRDRVLPVCWLQQAVGLPAKSRAERQLLRVVVLAAGEKRVGLVVDQLVGQEETVIKPISSHLRHIQGLSGATISGDGEVRLILDPAGIIQLIEEHTTRGS
jgi:two-component system chemotaxis sensor kinase CheA